MNNWVEVILLASVFIFSLISLVSIILAWKIARSDKKKYIHLRKKALSGIKINDDEIDDLLT